MWDLPGKYSTRICFYQDNMSLQKQNRIKFTPRYLSEVERVAYPKRISIDDAHSVIPHFTFFSIAVCHMLSKTVVWSLDCRLRLRSIMTCAKIAQLVCYHSSKWSEATQSIRFHVILLRLVFLCCWFFRCTFHTRLRYLYQMSFTMNSITRFHSTTNCTRTSRRCRSQGDVDLHPRGPTLLRQHPVDTGT